MSRSKKTILVAMSGGVDSSIAAALLKKLGHEVIGLTMQIWQESQTDPRHAGCCSLGAVEDARRVARLLDIPHYVLNFKDAFRQAVIDNFVEEYSAGRTPNPCVRCNKHVKFEILLDKMREFGCEILATGHYARVRRVNGVTWLMRARGAEKDQSYVLANLDQAQLRDVMFPLGHVPNKSEVRALAKELNLPVADKPDSQEICFVSEAGGYREFLKKVRPEIEMKGELVDTTGKVVGTHAGVANFTIGQRRGLGVSNERPLFVLELQPKENRVVVGSADQLLAQEVHLTDVQWGGTEIPVTPFEVTAKIRYNMAPQAAVVYPGSNSRLIFKKPVRAVTPGQVAVAYRGQTVMMGATILSSIPLDSYKN